MLDELYWYDYLVNKTFVIDNMIKRKELKQSSINLMDYLRQSIVSYQFNHILKPIWLCFDHTKFYICVSIYMTVYMYIVYVHNIIVINSFTRFNSGWLGAMWMCSFGWGNKTHNIMPDNWLYRYTLTNRNKTLPMLTPSRFIWHYTGVQTWIPAKPHQGHL